MTGRDATTAFAAALVDEWARAGVTDAVVSPGIALDAARARARPRRARARARRARRALGRVPRAGPRARDRPARGGAVHLGHRGRELPSGGGRGVARARPAARVHRRPPAGAARHGRRARRSTRRISTATRCAGSAIPARRPTNRTRAPRGARSRAARSPRRSGRRAGPVHLNLPFREPLLPTGAALVDAPGRADGRPWTGLDRGDARARRRPMSRASRDLVRAHPRGLLVAGWGAGVAPATAARFAAAAGWPVLADPISQLRTGPGAISTYEALLRAAGLRRRAPARSRRPRRRAAHEQGRDRVARSVDRAGARRSRRRVARSAPRGRRALRGRRRAVARRRSPTELGEPQPVTRPWLTEWLDAERVGPRRDRRVLDAPGAPAKGRSRATSPPRSPTARRSSSRRACRCARSSGAWRRARGLRVLANRGANGIDGFVSTVIGVAQASAPARTVGLCGDLCFLHDTNGLLGATGPATFVVLDNDGGGIFSYLPPAELPGVRAAVRHAARPRSRGGRARARRGRGTDRRRRQARRRAGRRERAAPRRACRGARRAASIAHASVGAPPRALGRPMRAPRSRLMR